MIDLEYNHKIFKDANDKSIMDVTASLEYWVPKKGEEVYEGKIIISITDKEADYIRSFVSKSVAKVLFHAMKMGIEAFNQRFPNGFTDYGGNPNKAPLISKILSVTTTQQGQFLFTALEKPGFKGKQGNVLAKKDSAPLKTAKRYVDEIRAAELALEVLDYIHFAEQQAFNSGRPLVTLTPKKEKENEKEEKTEPAAEAEQQEPLIPFLEEEKTPVPFENEIFSEMFKEVDEYTFRGGKVEGMKFAQFPIEIVKKMTELDETSEDRKKVIRLAKIEYMRRQKKLA
ncbi:hypothetical protein [Aneurinibacillus tyrosinisolvens]|uniref:hypothetical protein n=1 Tax=Aneurinibacillus tyrosinisolvens TaxID=1443435 RepID=UPI00063F8457|nr:hypothetical protein [Aneurinibacillus tyrosinisolvens]